MNNDLELLRRSLSDFFTSKMIRIALVPLIVTMIILYIVFFSLADMGLSSVNEMAQAAQNGQEIVLDEDLPFFVSWIVSGVLFLFKYSATAWLASFLLYSVGIAIVLQVSIVLSLGIIGFFTPMILKTLHKRHYIHLKMQGDSSLISPIIVFLKAFFMMIVIFILLIPSYFIPFIGFITLNLPLYYFFHKLLTYDVASTILSKEEFKIIYKKEAKNFRLRTLFLYFLSMVPFVTLFSTVYFI
ncbi:MAG: hypothetical protein CSA86_06300, partial [Arcobacter sp.]